LNKKIIHDRVLGVVALTVWVVGVGLYIKYPTKHPPYPPAEALEESGHYAEAQHARERLAEQRGEPTPKPRIHRDGEWQGSEQE
jgi:hypothetical protein